MKKFLILTACLFTTGLQAWDCEFEESIDEKLDLTGTELLSISAAAGDLEITGVAAGSTARIKGRLCVSDQDWLDESGVSVSGGREASIVVDLPRVESNWSLTGSKYAYLDLEIEVPEGMALDVRDSSGNMSIERVGGVKVMDSSGDIEIEDISGSAVVKDSSGDIVFRNIGGDVTIESDSSGDIRGTDIDGSVLVRSDSSGDIRFRDVGEDYIVERDSSGDISADGVGGDFHVLNDGSGDIDASNVQGEVITPTG
jgi:hypothetical protein